MKNTRGPLMGKEIEKSGGIIDWDALIIDHRLKDKDINSTFFS